MPSSTSLLEADEGESEVPPPLVHAFAGIGLEESGTQSQSSEQAGESLSHHHHQHQLPPASHFSLLGTVLDLKPLSLHRPPSEEEVNISAAPDDETEVVVGDSNSGSVNVSSTLLTQARHHHVQSGPGGSGMPSGMEPPPPAETILLYNGDDRDDAGGLQPANNGMLILPSGVYGEPSYEAEPSLMMRRKSVNTTECVAVPSSEHVAEIVGRQGECCCLEVDNLTAVWMKL